MDHIHHPQPTQPPQTQLLHQERPTSPSPPPIHVSSNEIHPLQSNAYNRETIPMPDPIYFDSAGDPTPFPPYVPRNYEEEEERLHQRYISEEEASSGADGLFSDNNSEYSISSDIPSPSAFSPWTIPLPASESGYEADSDTDSSDSEELEPYLPRSHPFSIAYSRFRDNFSLLMGDIKCHVEGLENPRRIGNEVVPVIFFAFKNRHFGRGSVRLVDGHIKYLIGLHYQGNVIIVYYRVQRGGHWMLGEITETVPGSHLDDVD